MPDYRVTQGEVEAIIETDVADLLPFIVMADLLVTEKLAGLGLSDDMLKEITRWLSAHFVAIRDPRAKQEKTGEAAATFFLGKEGTGLNSTPYGQQALLADITGTLSGLGKGIASVKAIA